MMTKCIRLAIWFILLNGAAKAQDLKEKLRKEISGFEADSQMKHASLGLLVMESKSGRVLFQKNAELGLAPASCQKVITAGAAFELLGKDFRYKTEFRYAGTITDSLLKGDIYIIGKGDPSLGSARYANTRADLILQNVSLALHKTGIARLDGGIVSINNGFETQLIPDGWIWEDIGNYYGTGCSFLNWRENQYELTLRPGSKPGDSVRIAGSRPDSRMELINELKTAGGSSGDNAYIYFSPQAGSGFLRGSIPCCLDSFVISGAVPDPEQFALDELEKFLQENRFYDKGKSVLKLKSNVFSYGSRLFYTQVSPSLDSITYWFLRKSINLYGEALIKSLGYEKGGFGSTARGIAVIQDFWSAHGIDRASLNIMDGSGLSPQNRISAHALVTAMNYARSRPWFRYFFDALPEINGIKMKSGSIEAVRTYTGYIQSKKGQEYTFAIIVNNFDGNPADVIRKMWKILDLLK